MYRMQQTQQNKTGGGGRVNEYAKHKRGQKNVVMQFKNRTMKHKKKNVQQNSCLIIRKKKWLVFKYEVSYTHMPDVWRATKLVESCKADPAH